MSANHRRAAQAFESLRAEVRAVEPKLALGTLRRFPDSIETSVDLVYRIEQQTVDRVRPAGVRSTVRCCSLAGATKPIGGDVLVLFDSALRLREHQLFLALTIVVGVLAGLSAVLFTVAIE